MLRRGDERAVTVQIGAVLLFAILFSALALYQLNAVPAENQQVEYTHNQEVRDEMQDLRNAIQNVGTSGGTQSTSVTLGTQYPSRTVAVNPPAARGTLETTGTANLSLENATVEGTYAGEGDPDDLLGDHETRTLAYEPSYNEYSTAPITRIEHGFAFNDFGDAQIGLTGQPLIDDDRLTIVLVEGELSTSSSSATTVDVRIASGPTDRVDIETSDGSLELPTQSPDVWNQTLEEQSNATPTAYADGTLTIELEDGTYELQMARVGIGEGSDSSDEFDVRKPSSDDGSGPGLGPATNVTDPEESERFVQGQDIDIEAVVSDFKRGGYQIYAAEWYHEEGDGDQGPGENNPMTADGGFSTVEETVGDTASTDDWEPGEHTIVVRGQDARGNWGPTDQVTVVIESPTGPFFDVTIEDTDSPVDEGETLSVTATVENTGTETGTQDVALDTDGQQRDSTALTLESGESTQVTLEWTTSGEDAGEYTATVSSADTDDTVGVAVEATGGPTVDLFTTEQRPGNNVGIRYSWDVSSTDAELETVVVELYRDGTPVDEHRYEVSGESASRNNEVFDNLGDGQEYTLELTVTDVEGNTESETRTQVAG